MIKTPQDIIKNILVAATMGLAAFASWAVTDFPAPAIEAAVSVNANS